MAGTGINATGWIGGFAAEAAPRMLDRSEVFGRTPEPPEDVTPDADEAAVGVEVGVVGPLTSGGSGARLTTQSTGEGAGAVDAAELVGPGSGSGGVDGAFSGGDATITTSGGATGDRPAFGSVVPEVLRRNRASSDSTPNRTRGRRRRVRTSVIRPKRSIQL